VGQIFVSPIVVGPIFIGPIFIGPIFIGPIFVGPIFVGMPQAPCYARQCCPEPTCHAGAYEKRTGLMSELRREGFDL
jgi:hypothetical protein